MLKQEIRRLERSLKRLKTEWQKICEEIERVESEIEATESAYTQETWGLAYGDELVMTDACEQIFRKDNQEYWFPMYSTCTFTYADIQNKTGFIQSPDNTTRGNIPMHVIAEMRQAWLKAPKE